MISRLIRLFVSVLFVTLLSPSAFAAGERQVTDLAGRTVTLPEGVERIVLGEGRLLSAIAILDHDDPLRRVAGMLDDYRLLDPDGYARWRQAFPGQDDVPVLGQVSASSFSVEKAIAVKPDLAIFTVGGHGPGTDASTVIAQLEAAGIPVIFVDFFLDPLTNTPASMALLGEVLGRPKRAQAFNAAFAAARSRVTDALAGVTERPSVFMEIRVGLGQDCCASVGQGALASLIEVAGGRNIAAPLIPGTGGMVSIEHLLTINRMSMLALPLAVAAKMVSARGALFSAPVCRPTWPPAASPRHWTVSESATWMLCAPGGHMPLWHHFFHGPFNVVALQVLAKWFHPELFADLDPARTLDSLMTAYLPVDLSGTYWTDIP